MEIYDFDSCDTVPTLGYGGRAGRKIAIMHEGAPWLLKFPESTRLLPGRDKPGHHLPSYTTSPLSEYVGSHVYEALGIPVHRTHLGRREGKIVVACKDFAAEDRLVDFAALKNTVNEDVLESGNSSSNDGELLSDALRVIEDAEALAPVREKAREHFWDMFVVDALILNNDRNNGNWGLLVKRFSVEMAPVFDNGNAFFNKRNASLAKQRLESDELVGQDVQASSSFFKSDGGHRIHPLSFIAEGQCPECNAAVLRIAERLSAGAADAVFAMIDELPDKAYDLPVAPPEYRELYRRTLELTINAHLLPAAKKLLGWHSTGA